MIDTVRGYRQKVVGSGLHEGSLVVTLALNISDESEPGIVRRPNGSRATRTAI